MKNIFTYIAGTAAALFALSSCNVLEVESPSTFDASIVYSNYTLAEGTIFGITESFCETNSYRGRFLPWYGFNTDIEWYNAFGGSKKVMDGKNEIASYGILPNNAQLSTKDNPYVLMYTGIERANLVIEGLREYGNTSSDKDMAYLLGEALTLRAMIYYDIIKAWGDVPARFHSIKDNSDIYKGKDNRDLIYKQILSDLEEAIPYLYYPNASPMTQRTDRINKVFAEGLYARIALAASGYALRVEDGNEGRGEVGTVRLSADPDLLKEVLYPKALSFLKDAINSGTARLIPDYETLWRNFNSNDLSAGNEVLYVIPFGDRGRWNYTFAIKNEGATINGTAFSQGGQAGPVPSFYFDFADDDVRRDLSCVNYSWQKDGSILPAGIGKWYFGKFRFEWMDNNPYTGGNDDGIKPVVMRYSDILLMAAEIANDLDDLAYAKECFKEVRARATSEEAADAYVAAIGGKDAMFDRIVDERAFEFCGEFLRKADLIRWNMLKTKLDEAKTKMMDLREMKGDYNWLSGSIYYRPGEDEESLEIWGLRKGEQTAPSDAGWELDAKYFTFDDAKETGLYSAKISNIYIPENPELFMYWPIFQDTINNSQNALANDFGYVIQ